MPMEQATKNYSFSKKFIEFSGANVTIAFLCCAFLPINLPTRRFFNGKCSVFTEITLTSKSCSIANLITFLLALESTAKLY